MRKNSCITCHYESNVAKHYGCKRLRHCGTLCILTTDSGPRWPHSCRTRSPPSQSTPSTQQKSAKLHREMILISLCCLLLLLFLFFFFWFSYPTIALTWKILSVFICLFCCCCCRIFLLFFSSLRSWKIWRPGGDAGICRWILHLQQNAVSVGVESPHRRVQGPQKYTSVALEFRRQKQTGKPGAGWLWAQ